MTVPVKTKTWQYNVDNAITSQGTAGADNSAQLFAIVGALIGFASSAWVVDYSCLTTGNVGTKGDGVNRWSSAAALVFNTAGSAHSWIVLKQTGIASTFELLIDLNNSAATHALAAISVSFSAGFTGGSATAAPTATDQKVLATTWTSQTTDLASRWSVMMSTDGQCTRIFCFAAGNQTVGAFLDFPLNATTGWTNPSIAYWLGGAFSTTNMAAANFFSNYNGTIASSLLTCESTLAGSVLTNQTVVNDIDSNWPALPIGFYVSATVGGRGRQGTLQDMWFGSNSVPTGDTYPVATADYAQVGQVILPWNNGSFHLS